jgi:polyphosphate kinase
VEDERLRKKLRFLLDAQLDDQRAAWEMQPDGTYVQRVPGRGRKAKGSQQILIERAEQRHKDATRLRKRRAKGVARRQWR